jgi:DNA-binding protein H-NS
MQVIITESKSFTHDSYITASCGKKTALVIIHRVSKRITVCCQNASHKVWRGAGRTFWSIEEALDAYKSSEMKAIISAAVEA